MSLSLTEQRVELVGLLAFTAVRSILLASASVPGSGTHGEVPGLHRLHREMVPDTKKTCVFFGPIQQIHLTQSKRFAEAALAHYNRGKKIKFELVDVKPYNSVPELRCCYTHINFTARSIKEVSQEQLFFAELFHWGIRRDNINARSNKKCSQLSFSGRSQSPRGGFL